MNSTNCWKLFSGDIEGWIEDQCGRAYIDKQTAHWMMNYGYYDIVAKRLKSKKISTKSIAEDKAIKFRLNREGEKKNPYIGILDLTNEQSQKIKNLLDISYVALSGGIGDHIEQISRIKSCLNNQNKKLKLVTTANRINQLKTLVDGACWKERSNTRNTIDFHLLMAAYQDNQPVASQLKNREEYKPIYEYDLVCCWNAAGKGDKVSRWIRSLRFEEIVQFYNDIKNRGYKGKILDISYWREWEKKNLTRLGILTYDPSEGNTKDLANKISKAKRVISIDTALVHLSAAIGKEIIVLLPKVSDERWKSNTLPGNSYEKYCYMMRQSQWNSWHNEFSKIKSRILQGLT